MLKEDPAPLTHCEHSRVGHGNQMSPDVTGRKEVNTWEHIAPWAVCKGGSSGNRRPGVDPALDTLKLCDCTAYTLL